jgi:hypothetical protein
MGVLRLRIVERQGGGQVKEFLFDARLLAAIRVHAESEEEARKLILDTIDANTVNLGAWPNGDPIVAEASAERTWLVEIDGEESEPEDDEDEYVTGDCFQGACDRDDTDPPTPLSSKIMDEVDIDLVSHLDKATDAYVRRRAVKRGRVTSAAEVIASVALLLASNITRAEESLPSDSGTLVRTDVTAAFLLEMVRMLKREGAEWGFGKKARSH